MNDSEIIDAIIRREGSAYTNDPDDKGGATRWGVTQNTLAEYRGRPVTVRDVAELTEAQARIIYQERYIMLPGFNKIGWQEVRAALVDAAVNHGAGQAVRMLQRVAGVREDGVLGPITLEALAALGERAARAKLAAERVRLYGRILSSKPDQAKFAFGWLSRAAEFVEGLA